jgi:AraC-like DNA-binding protein
MNTSARHLCAASSSWQDIDPVLTALRDARTRRDQAARDIRILLAYARELTHPRPYRLADLAAATGMSISGIRTAYTHTDIDAARQLLRTASHQDACQHFGGSDRDLHQPPR